MKNLPLLILLLCLTGCGSGFGRLFQAKVPAPITKSPQQVEAERRSADLIARTIEKPEELKPVAQGLSSSLGKPQKQIEVNKPEELPKAASVATAELQTGLANMQKQITELNQNLVKYQGKEIEGTGFSVLGPGIITIMIVLGIVAVVCPPVMTLLFFAFRRLKAVSKIVVNELETAAQDPETKAAVDSIKSSVRDKMKAHPMNTELLKNVVLDLKKS